VESRNSALLVKVLRVVGIVLLVLCAGVATAAGLTYSHARAFVAGASQAQGVVSDVQEERDPDGDLMYATVVRFTDATGRQHSVRSSVLESPAPFKVGDRADVLYPPGRPDEARIARFSELYFLPLMLGVTAGAQLIGALFFLFAVPRLARWRARKGEPAAPKRSGTWFIVRMGILALAFAGGALSFLDTEAADTWGLPLWGFGIVVVLSAALMPFIVCLLIGMSSLLSGSGSKWARPSHSSPPLSFNNPLLFFHFAGCLAAACGLGTVLSSPLGGLGQLANGAGVLIGGIGVLAGVRLGMRLCSGKMAGGAPAAPESIG
jgi:hypothetical protein